MLFMYTRTKRTLIVALGAASFNLVPGSLIVDILAASYNLVLVPILYMSCVTTRHQLRLPNKEKICPINA